MTLKAKTQKKWWKRRFTCNLQKDPAGKRWAVHEHAVDEIVLPLDRPLDLTVGAKKLKAAPGKEIVIPPHTPHAIHNPNHHEATYLYGFKNK